MNIVKTKDIMNGAIQMDIFWIVLFGLISCTSADWSTWSQWSPCSITCGDGIQTRNRKCVPDVPGDNCTGSSVMYNVCNLGNCGQQTDVWSVWGDWSVCSKTCGGGIHVRTRTCLLGDVTECCAHLDREGCEYEHYQTRECINNDCLGHWSSWKPWSKCSATCGEGNQTRQRDCVPAGTVCPGPNTQMRSCYVQCGPSSSGLNGKPSCSYLNPCLNGGVCARGHDHVRCFCQGDWRGSDCGSLCLRLDAPNPCSDKEGIFHVCNACSRFVICSRGKAIPMSCMEGWIWTESGCKLPADTDYMCIEW